MSSDEINQDQNAQDEKNKELLLEIFYKTKDFFYLKLNLIIYR